MQFIEYIEAVDPEDRNIRRAKLYKGAERLRQAWDMARRTDGPIHDRGANDRKAKWYKVRSLRAQAVADAHSPNDADKLRVRSKGGLTSKNAVNVLRDRERQLRPKTRRTKPIGEMTTTANVGTMQLPLGTVSPMRKIEKKLRKKKDRWY